MGGKRLDLTGKVFGRLTVVSREKSSASGWFWRVRCSCGNERVVRTGKLNNGEYKSCGCLRADRMKAHHVACRVEVINGRRRCSKCKKNQPVDMFSKSAKTHSGLQYRCSDCAIIYDWKKRFNLTDEEAHLLLEERSNNICAVCHEPGDLHLDHDHKTNQLRGFLCGNCNRALGLLRDDPAIIQRLITYIQRDGTGLQRLQLGAVHA